MRLVCSIKQRELGCVVSHVHLSETYGASIFTSTGLDILFGETAFLVIPVSEKDVSP